MKIFVIETQELIDSKLKWKKIAVTPILAEDSYRALLRIEKRYGSKQYIHKIISMVERRQEGVVWKYFQ